MSATSSNARSGWIGLAAPRAAESRDEAGRNALQALFAFACLHQQTQDRRGGGKGPGNDSPDAPEQEFALDEVLQMVAARALSITGADGIAIALAHEGAIICRASAGKIAPDRGVKLDPTSGFSGACLRSGETIRCDDSEIDTRVNALACRALGTRSMVAVPLAAKQHVIGLIEAFSKETYGFNDSDLRSLNLLGELILAAIRPEEEDRLTEISRKVIAEPAIPPPEVAQTSETLPEAATTPQAATAAPAPETAIAPPEAPPSIPEIVAMTTAKILVDEKFTPVPASVPGTPAMPQKSEATPGAAAEHKANLVSPVPEVQETAARPTPVIEESGGPASAAAKESAEPELEAFRFKWLQSDAEAEPEVPRVAPAPSRSIPARALVTAAVLLIFGLGWVGWRQIRHAEQAASASTPTASEVRSEETTPQEIPAPPAPVAKAGTLPELTGIHNSTSANASTVVIDLEDQVQYEAHTLSNPDRIYFDLHDTKMAPGLANQSIDLDNDPFLKRIRVAQPVDGVTRVVLETKGTAEFTVSLEPNPYRLNIEVHKPIAATDVKGTIAPQEKPSPSISTAPGKPTPTAASSEFRLVLDAGHGGWDLGTVGKKGLLEKDLVLDVVERLGKLVEEKMGAEVIYTRQDDEYLPLEKRAEIANLAKASLFLSVHANYSDLSTARGVETYYTNTYSSVKARTDGDDPQLKQVDWTGVDIRAKVTDSHRLAADVQQALYGALAARTPDIRNRGVKEAQYVVLTGTQMPAVLAEVSFVSSPADEDKLQSSEYRQQIAEALYRGIARYRTESKQMKLASAKKN